MKNSSFASRASLENGRGFCYYLQVRLSEEAERYYKQACGQRTKVIGEWFNPAMEKAQSFMPPGGVRGKGISNLIIERWRRLLDARIESLLEAYEQYEIRFEKTDVDEFVNGLRSALPNLQASLANSTGGRGTSTHFAFEIDQINRQARQRLLFEVTKAELKRKRTKRDKKMKRKEAKGVEISSGAGSTIQVVGGEKNRAKISTSQNIQFNQTINELRQRFKETKELENPDRAEAITKIDKLTVLANREESPKRLEKVKRNIETLASIASKTKDLVVMVSPLIQRVRDHWPSIW